MYRFLFRPIWLLFHLVVVAAVVGMLWASVWQVQRLEERKEFNRVVVERSEQAPIPLSDMLDDLESGRIDASGAEWRRVTTSGTYLPDQVLEFNNSQGGQAGDNVLTALLVEGSDDTTVIVNRGFVPLGFDIPDAPAVRVEIIGFIRPSEVRRRGGVTDARTDEPLTEIRRIDIPELAKQFPGNVAPVFVQLTGALPEIVSGDPEPVRLPDIDNGPHLSYAIQWFIFAFSVVVGWVLAVRRSIRQHTRDLLSNQDPALDHAMPENAKVMAEATEQTATDSS